MLLCLSYLKEPEITEFLTKILSVDRDTNITVWKTCFFHFKYNYERYAV
jgi:hypothetical protein